jgi:hypothetical protein
LSFRVGMYWATLSAVCELLWALHGKTAHRGKIGSGLLGEPGFREDHPQLPRKLEW